MGILDINFDGIVAAAEGLFSVLRNGQRKEQPGWVCTTASQKVHSGHCCFVCPISESLWTCIS